MITRDIAGYVSRDWAAVREAKDRYWAERIGRLGAGEGLRIADELRRQMQAIDPAWPSVTDRQLDLAAHAHLAEWMRRADRARRG